MYHHFGKKVVFLSSLKKLIHFYFVIQFAHGINIFSGTNNLTQIINSQMLSNQFFNTIAYDCCNFFLNFIRVFLKYHKMLYIMHNGNWEKK